MNSMKRQKDSTLKDELPRLVGAQYATGDQWRNNSRKNGETEPKQKQHTVVDATGVGSKVRYYKEHSCLENPMNSMKRQKDRTLKDELLRSVGAQYIAGLQVEK